MKKRNNEKQSNVFGLQRESKGFRSRHGDYTNGYWTGDSRKFVFYTKIFARDEREKKVFGGGGGGDDLAGENVDLQ